MAHILDTQKKRMARPAYRAAYEALEEFAPAAAAMDANNSRGDFR